MLKFAIPGMYELKDTIFAFLEMKQNHPEYFYDDVEIEIAYGNPQFCIWDGGRIFTHYKHSNIEDIQQTIDTYNNTFGIPIRYVFTNCLLQPEHYLNRFENILMQLGSKGNNEVVLFDDNLLKYLQENYPSYKFVSSTTKCILDKEKVKEELHRDDFKLVCLDYNLNHDIDFLNTLTPEEKAKTEFLVNAICPPGCPNRKDHYYLNSYSHLHYGQPYTMENCGITYSSFHPSIQKWHLTYQDLHDVYAPMGFEHFKIEGRTWNSLDLVITLCNYMIKPEYKNFVISGLGVDHA